RWRSCREPRYRAWTPGTANGVGVPQYALCDATVIWCSRKRTTSACSGRSRRASAAARSSASQASQVVRWASSLMTAILIVEGDRPEHLHLVLQLHPLLPRPAARLAHQREDIGRLRAAMVLDEVRMHRRDPRAADGVALETALLEQAAGGALRVGVLPHRPE